MLEYCACINCGDMATNLHHVVPRVLGGGGGSNLVPLCGFCHDKVHDTKHLTLKELQRVGIEKAKEKGLYKGRPATISKLEVCYWTTKGLGAVQISKKMKISRQTVYRIWYEDGLKNVKVRLRED